MEIVFKSIGIIHSPFREKDHTPIQGLFSKAAGTVEVFPEYAEGLRDIEGFSHIFLIYQFHHTEECKLVRKPFLDNSKERGIFATRHFCRPNPIGLSIVELKSVKGNVLEVYWHRHPRRDSAAGHQALRPPVRLPRRRAQRLGGRERPAARGGPPLHARRAQEKLNRPTGLSFRDRPEEKCSGEILRLMRSITGHER